MAEANEKYQEISTTGSFTRLIWKLVVLVGRQKSMLAYPIHHIM